MIPASSKLISFHSYYQIHFLALYISPSLLIKFIHLDSGVASSINDDFPLYVPFAHCGCPPWFNRDSISLEHSQGYHERLWRGSLSHTSRLSLFFPLNVCVCASFWRKKSYCKYRLTSLSSSLEALWPTINALSGLNNPSTCSCPSAAELAQFFADQVHNTRSSVHVSSISITYPIFRCNFNNFSHISLSDIISILS